MFTDLVEKSRPFVTPETVERRAKEALQNGLTLVGNPTGEQENNRKYHLYQFDTCGHTQNIDASLAKLGKFKCRQCEDNYLHKEAEEQGLTLVERASYGKSSLYEFNECKHTQRIGYSAVRRGQFKCQQCYYADGTAEEKIHSRARQVGLEFLGKTKSLSHGNYRRIECGHEFKYQISAITNLLKGGMKPRCPVCMQDSEEIALNENSVEMLDRDGEIATVRYKSCGHIRCISMHVIKTKGVTDCSVCRIAQLKLTIGALGVTLTDEPNATANKCKLNGCGHDFMVYSAHINGTTKINCKVCYEASLAEAALKHGIVLHGKSHKGAHYRNGTFVDCGHNREFESHSFMQDKRDSYFCQQCADNRKVTEALAVGLVLVGKADNNNPNYRQYEMQCCKTKQDIEYNHVKENSWTCYNCQTNQYTKPSNLYLLKINNDELSWLKLGYAKDIDDRILGYNLVGEVAVEILKTYPFTTGLQVLHAEKQIHKQMKKHRLDPRDMIKYKSSGFSECYPLDKEQVLLDKMHTAFLENQKGKDT